MNAKTILQVCRACLGRRPTAEFKALLKEPTRGIFYKSTLVYVEEDTRFPLRICDDCVKKCTLWLEFRETVQNNDKMLHSIINGETLELPFPVDKEIRQKSKRLPFRRMPAEEETDSDEPLVVTRSDSKTKHTKILCPVPDCDSELAGFRRFEDHCLTHLDSTKNIRCPICRFAYKRSDNFRKHMYVHTNQKFQCSDCERMFNNPKSLNDHLRIVHKIFARDDPEDKRCKGARNTIVPDAIKCPVCKLDLSSFKDYDEHMGTHISREDRSCPLCQKEINHYGNLKKHMFSHTDIQFTCQFCSEQFDNTMKYRNHIKVTHKKIFYYEKDEEVTDEEEDSEFPTECVLCQESISTQEERVAHMVEEHSKEQGLCTDCGMILSSEHELRAHKLKKHSGDWIDCDECDEKFNSVRRFREHRQKTHRGVKPHQCEICGLAYRRQTNLTSHMKEAHKKKDDADEDETSSD